MRSSSLMLARWCKRLWKENKVNNNNMEKLFIQSSKADTVAGGIEKRKVEWGTADNICSMIDVRDLEIERHYLSEAIKSSRNSAEYDFLSRKLCSVRAARRSE